MQLWLTSQNVLCMLLLLLLLLRLFADCSPILTKKQVDVRNKVKLREDLATRRQHTTTHFIVLTKAKVAALVCGS